MITLKRQAKPSRTNTYIDLIEDIANATADEVTLTKQDRKGFDTCYQVAVKGEIVGWVLGHTGANYRDAGPRLQVRLGDTVKWSTQSVGHAEARKTSARSRIEAVYNLAQNTPTLNNN